MNTRTDLIASTLLAASLVCGTAHADLPSYTFTDLGTLGGASSQARAINAAGQVVGWAYTAGGGTMHATLWNGTTATDLGGAYSEAYAINAAGQVVGTSSTAGNATYHATLWNGTTATDLGMGGAYAINSAGQVVGISNTAGNAVYHATLWNGTTATDLGTLGGDYSVATAINTAGLVVGYSNTTGDTFSHATLWNGTTVTDLNGFLDTSAVNAGWKLEFATGINDNGWIVGGAVNTLTGNTHAFLLSVASVPEPETYAMMLAGLGLVGLATRRRKLVKSERSVLRD